MSCFQCADHRLFTKSNPCLNFKPALILLGEPKKERTKYSLFKIVTLVNRDTDNLSLSLSIILKLRNQIFNKERSEP